MEELKSIASKEGVRGARSKTKYTNHNREDLIRDIRYSRKETCLLDGKNIFREVFLSISVGFVVSTILYFYRSPKKEPRVPKPDPPMGTTIELKK